MPPITTGLALWLDASDTASMQVFDDGVFNWNDKVGGLAFYYAGGDWPQLDETYFPYPSVDFGTGSAASYMTSSGVTVTLPATVFKVIRWPTTVGDTAAFALQTGSAEGAIASGFGRPFSLVWNEYGAPAGAQRYGGSNFADARALSAGDVNTPHVLTYRVPEALSAVEFRVDGVAVSVDGYDTAPSTWTIDTIGSSDNTYAAAGAVAEILVYEGALSTAEVEAVEEYLADKWLGSGGGGVSVDVTGVEAVAEVGPVVAAAGADAVVTGVALQSGLGSVVVSANSRAAVFGVDAEVAVSQVLVWSAVNDTQSTGWAPVNTAQGSPWLGVGPGTVTVAEFDGPGSAAIASEPLAGSSSFSYTPNAVVWRPVLTSA